MMTSEVIHISGKTGSADDLAVARRVLETEAAGLQKLAAALDQSFVDAVDMISSIEGRLIITGMGKSGHVGRKIAATMASTGTPSFFVHPGEASHGDLGMIVRGDAIFAISNSGESREMTDLIEYARRFAIPLIGLTRAPESTLAKRSDIVLLLPDVGEACPNGMAPTTSSTMTLALGDALAIALLERKGFTAQDFKKFHPGGKLGQQLLQVSELMHTKDALPLAEAGTLIRDALPVMTNKNFGVIGITDKDGLLLGIVTDGDIRRHITADLPDKTVDEIMTRNPKVIAPDAIVAEAMAQMNELNKITCLFVIEDSRPVGLLHMHDCLRAGIS